jgi:hypothetical protein
MAEDASTTPRGRPPVFSEDVLRRASGYSYARQVRTRRGSQDLVYRMFALAVLEHYCEAYPARAEELAWFLRPRRRHTLLTELGRIARPRSDGRGFIYKERDVSRMIEAAVALARAKPPTKVGVALLRSIRADAERADAQGSSRGTT